FIHAFARGADRRKVILIKASLEEDRIRAVVEDNGDGMGERQIENLYQEGAEKGKNMFASIGIGNVRQRIRALFGADYDLRIESEPGKYTRVTAVIPKIKGGNGMGVK
ncbi:MAG: hypothetical protein LBR83_07950, partial [Clostridiales bacterium]|nr:hypothetical protein [Clostridiales bacterium]